MRYSYKTKPKNYDDRSKFANDICKLILLKTNYDLELAVKEVKIFYDYCEEHVRNIYELIDEEIPLFGLYYLKAYDADNFSFAKKEYLKAINNASKACLKLK